jgi:ribosomal protein L7/L12
MESNQTLLLIAAVAVIIVTVIVMTASGCSTGHQAANWGSVQRQLDDLQRKLDALLAHHGIAPPPPPSSGLSQEVERLASRTETKIAAIKLYRQQNPGVGLADAKAKIDEFAEGRGRV